jgi:hypothetical protein
MKMTRSNLKALIIKEIKASKSVLLESPLGNADLYSYRAEDNEEPVDLLAQKLHHMGRQADSLLQMVAADSGDALFTKETRQTIEDVADRLDKVFKAVDYDRSSPAGR